MSSPKPSRKKAREKGQERTPVDEHEEMGQDASNSGGKASSCGGCAPKSSMPAESTDELQIHKITNREEENHLVIVYLVMKYASKTLQRKLKHEILNRQSLKAFLGKKNINYSI